MISISQIDHIVLRTDKLEQMLLFYCDVLGCRIERQTSAKLGLTQLRAGNALIDLVSIESELGQLGGGAPKLTENNLDHFCLQLKPISSQDLRQYLQQHGIEVGEFEMRYGAQGFGESIYIKDPQGNTIELKTQI